MQIVAWKTTETYNSCATSVLIMVKWFSNNIASVEGHLLESLKLLKYLHRKWNEKFLPFLLALKKPKQTNTQKNPSINYVNPNRKMWSGSTASNFWRMSCLRNTISFFGKFSELWPSLEFSPEKLYSRGRVHESFFKTMIND